MTRRQRIVSLCATVTALIAAATTGSLVASGQGPDTVLADYHTLSVEDGDQDRTHPKGAANQGLYGVVIK